MAFYPTNNYTAKDIEECLNDLFGSIVNKKNDENYKWFNRYKVGNPIAISQMESWVSKANVIKKHTDDYRKEMSEKAKEIKYLIISEAPMITLDKSTGTVTGNYLLEAFNTKLGLYHSVPYNSFKSKEYYEEEKDLKHLFVKNQVGFLDIIPIPLLGIDSNTRIDWGKSATVTLPIVITRFDEAINNFLTTTQCKFADDLRIILLMPANTAMGIISYLEATTKLPSSLKELGKIAAKIIEINTPAIVAANPELYGKSVRLHKQIAINCSGHPDLIIFNHAKKQPHEFKKLH